MPRRRPELIDYARGLYTAVTTNSAAYGYSVVITASFGVLAVLDGAPAVGEIFLFIGGAAVAFTSVEAAASRGFRKTERAEPSWVVLVGTAFNFFSMSLALGAATLVAHLVGGWPAWAVGPLVATIVYMLVVGFEMALAERVED